MSRALTRRRMYGAAAATAAIAGLPVACGPLARLGEDRAATTIQPATLTYWDWAEVWRDLVRQLTDQFMATQPKLKVEWDILPGYWDKLQVAIAGDTSPDSWRMNGPNLPPWATRGLLADLSPLVAKDRQVANDLKTMAPVFQEYTRRQGRRWSIPFGNAISGILAYNEEQVQAEGLTPPAALPLDRWTWPVLLEYAVKLHRRDGSRHGYFSDWGSEVGWLPYLYARGGSVFDKEGKKATINSPVAQETLAYLVDLVQKHRVAPTREEIAQENAELRFLNGRLAIVPRGTWQIKDLNLKAKAFRWDLVPVPRAPQTGKGGSTSQLASVIMSPSTKKREAVWEWLKFIGSKAGQDSIARAEFFPGRVDSAETIYYKPELGPKSRPLLREVLKVTQPLPWVDVGGWNNWGPIANPLINQMFDGAVAVREGLQKMEQELNAAIEKQFR